MSEPVAWIPGLTGNVTPLDVLVLLVQENLKLKDQRYELLAALKDARRVEYGTSYYVVHLVDAAIAKYDTDAA